MPRSCSATASGSLACSSPTGPAFEGAQISCGQRAAPGAIERVRIDRETLEPRFKVIGSDLWSDEPGFAAATAATGVTGICGSGIIEVIAELYLAGVITQDGVIDGSLAARSPRVVAAGRTGVRAARGRADAAASRRTTCARSSSPRRRCYAGMRLLMERLAIEQRRPHPPRRRVRQPHRREVRDRARHDPRLRPRRRSPRPATPPAPARASRCSTQRSRPTIEALVRRIEKIETAIEPRFQEYFVEAMAIPHKTAQYPNLRKVVDLPPPKIMPQATGDGRARSRRPTTTRPA